MGLFDPRTNYKPFEYAHITDPLIEAMWGGHWTHKPFTFSGDVHDYLTILSDDEQAVVSRSLLMISQVEVSVKSYWANIGRLIPKPEIADMGAVFGGVEVIHSRAYSEILTKLGLDESFQTFLLSDVVKGRVNYLKKYLDKVYDDDRKQIVYSLILFTLFMENVSLFSQFFIILGFNRFRSVLKDVANVVQYTSKEEDIHSKGGIALIQQIRLEYPEIFDDEFTARVKQSVTDAILSEERVVSWILDGYSNEFLSESILMSYIKSRMNTALSDIGIDLVLDAGNFDHTWMDEEICLPAQSDFFNKDPIDYTKQMQSFSPEALF